MRNALLVAACIAVSSASLALSATYPDRGRDIAAACAACHGTDGRSEGGMPRLAGRDAAEIVRLLREFRDGSKPSTVMQQLAKGYADDDIAAAAAYFAAQRSP